jgi:hypothetical protein
MHLKDHQPASAGFFFVNPAEQAFIVKNWYELIRGLSWPYTYLMRARIVLVWPATARAL